MKGRYHSLLWTMAPLCGLAASGVASAATGPATGDTSNMGIALSNPMRQHLAAADDEGMADAADSAMKQHLIAKTKIVNADNSAPQRQARSRILILDGWKAIGQRGLADSIERRIPDACSRASRSSCSTPGDRAVAPIRWRSSTSSWAGFPTRSLPNICTARGTSWRCAASPYYGRCRSVQGVGEILAKYPDIKVVGAVNGQLDGRHRQQGGCRLLPSLPQVDGVLARVGRRRRL